MLHHIYTGANSGGNPVSTTGHKMYKETPYPRVYILYLLQHVLKPYQRQQYMYRVNIHRYQKYVQMGIRKVAARQKAIAECNMATSNIQFDEGRMPFTQR